MERIDVENPAPGIRDGQIHYHEPNNAKHMFDMKNKVFKNPNKRIEALMKNPKFLKGLEKAYKILGE